MVGRSKVLRPETPTEPKMSDDMHDEADEAYRRGFIERRPNPG